jgi:hypothetical protein
MMYQVFLALPLPSEKRILIGAATSLEEATAVVAQLDRRFRQWEGQAFPEALADLRHLMFDEGCDILAIDNLGNTFMFMDPGWDPIAF